jgi:hypothetical protein
MARFLDASGGQSSMIAVNPDLANKWGLVARNSASRDATGVDATFCIAYPSGQIQPISSEANMIKRMLICVAAGFSLLLFAFLSLMVWASFYAEGSTSCQLASGRQIVCAATGIYISLETHSDTAIIRTMSRTVTIAPTKLQVDGRTVVTIPATTKMVDVRIRQGNVTFVADGEAVGSVWR